MSQFQFSAIPSQGGGGRLGRDVSSSAGDGFKAIFAQNVSPDSRESSEISPNNDSSKKEDPFSTFNSEPKVKPKTKDDLVFTKDVDDKDLSKLEQIVKKLETSSEGLSQRDIQTLSQEIEELVQDPKVSAEVREFLKSAGLNLEGLNGFQLTQSLESLPLQAQNKLAKVLETLKNHKDPQAPSLNEVLSEAFGQAVQSTKSAEAQSTQTTAANSQSETTARTPQENFENFLKDSKAQVTQTTTEEDKQLSRLQTKQKGQDLSQLPNSAKSQEAPLQNLQAPTTGQSEVPGLQALNVAKAEASIQTTAKSADLNANLSTEATKEAKGAKQAKTANVPLARSNLTTQIEQNRLLQKLVAKAKLFLNNEGVGNFKVRVEPATLGVLDIAISTNKEGALTSLITADNPAAKQVLQSNLADLKLALSTVGIELNDVKVTVDQQDSSEQSFAQAQQNQKELRQRQVTGERQQQDFDDSDVEEEASQINLNGQMSLTA